MNKIISLILFFLIILCSISHAQSNAFISIAQVVEIFEDVDFESVPFTINNAEGITSVALSVSSSNTVLVKNNNLLLNIQDMILRIKPEKNQYGKANINLIATNSEKITSTSTLNLIVKPVNDPPSLNPGESLQLTCTAGPQVITSWAESITPGPYEPDQLLSIKLIPENPLLFDVNPFINENGDLIFKPRPDNYGVTDILIILKDNGGTENNGIDSTEYKFTIETIKKTILPEFYITHNPVVPEDCGEKTIPGFIDISNTTVELDSEMSFQVHADNKELFEVPPFILNNGSLFFKPAKNAYGETTATVYIKTDTINSLFVSDPKSFSITILPVNDRPTFYAGGNYFADEDSGEQKFIWSSNITPGALNESDQILTFHIESIDRQDLFEIPPDISSDGVLTYKPAKDMFGKANITVYLKDNGGTENNGIDTSEKHSFSIDIFPVNDCPSFSMKQELIVSNNTGEIKKENWITNILLGPPNESDQTGYFETYVSDPTIFKQKPLITNDGTLIFEPFPYTSGIVTVSVVLIEDNKEQNDLCSSILQFFTINVEPLKYSMTLLVEGNGFIQLNDNLIDNFPWQEQLIADKNILCEAIPSEGWLFSHWSEALTETNAAANIVMDENKTLIAHFKSKPIVLSLKGKGWISLNENIFKLPCNHEVDQNEVINLKALNNFSHWTGDITSTSASISLTMNSDKELYAHYIHKESWQTELRISKKETDKPLDPSAQINDKIVIGMGEFYEESLDVKPSFYYCDMFIFSSENNEYLSKEIYEKGKDIYLWNIAIQPGGNFFEDSTTTFSWKPYELPVDGQFQLIEGFDGKGNVIINDMTVMSEHEVTGVTTKFYTIRWIRNSYTFDLQAGWNLISLPLIPENNELASLFPDSEIAYSYIDGSYEIANALEPGFGYWINIPQAETYKIYGKPFIDYSLTLSVGWHMLGALSEPANIKTEPARAYSVIFAFVDGLYQEVDEIKPGLGYWINITETCEFILNKSINNNK